MKKKESKVIIIHSSGAFENFSIVNPQTLQQ